jgi:DNA-binding NarL/FixJ family response regulator
MATTITDAAHLRLLETDPVAKLTTRELEILTLIAAGCSNQEIGDRLWLASKTVERHVHHILLKLDLRQDPAINRRVHAARLWWGSPLRSAQRRGEMPGSLSLPAA